MIHTEVRVVLGATGPVRVDRISTLEKEPSLPYICVS